MDAKNSSNRSKKLTQNTNCQSSPKTTKGKKMPKIPNTDQELKEIVSKAFPLPSVQPHITASILEQIKKQ